MLLVFLPDKLKTTHYNILIFIELVKIEKKVKTSFEIINSNFFVLVLVGFY